MHHTAFVPHSWVLPNRQHSRTTACALMSDRGYLLIQAFFLLGICYGFNLSEQFTSPVVLQLQTHPRSEFLYEGEVGNAG